MVASVLPVETPALEAVNDDDPDASAGVLLERAFILFHHDRAAPAAAAFRAAIATGNLNDAGRTLAYWHIFLCESRLEHEDTSTEALASFVVVAEDVLEERERLHYATTNTGDFVDRFDLAGRVVRARALLSAVWARRSPDFGRTQDNPVPVQDAAEGEFFLRYAPPCNDTEQRRVERGVVKGDGHIEHATIACESPRQTIEYYLQYPGEQP